MSVPFSNTKLRVPKGFETLLEGFAREVLRAQPKCIIQFGAMHFSNLLKVRSETGQDPVEGCADLEDRFYNNDSFKRGAEADVSTSAAETQMEAHSTKDEKTPADVNDGAQEISANKNGEDEDDAATKIQAGYKGYKVRKDMKDNMMKTNAATKIQAGFRGHLTRKNLKRMKDDEPKESEDTNNTEGTTDAEVVKETEGTENVEDTGEVKNAEDTENTTVTNEDTPKDDTKQEEVTNEEEVIDIDLNDPDVADAASKIQASFRGHKVRKEISKKQTEQPEGDKDANNSAIKEDNAIDIDLTDPEVSAAATKIQANFRGHQIRQKLKDTPKVTPSAADVHSEPTQKEEAETKQEEIDIDLTDPEVEAAAQKIQASFRGHMKLKRKQTISQEESQEKGTISSEKVEKISSAISGSSISRDICGVQKDKEDKDVTERKEKEEEEATKMKPIEPTVDKVKESGSAEGGKNEETSVVESAEVKKQEVPAEMEATATPQATEAEEIDIDLNDPDVAAATKKLQAGFRGRLNRRKKAKENALAASTEKCSSNPIPTPTSQTLTPVEVDSSAAKSSEIDDIDLNDPELAAAAVKIQASFRGHFTRKIVKKNEDVDPASEEAMSQKSDSATPVQDATGDQGQKDEKSINYEDPQVQLAATKIQAGFKGYQTRKSLKKQAGNSGDLEKDSGS